MGQRIENEKNQKKITIGILVFFFSIAVVIGGRTAIGNHF